MEWRVIEDFPIYEVSEFGHVRRIKTGKLLASVSDRGYQLYRLCRGSERPAVRAHTLVLKAFVGPRPFEGAEACHHDGQRDHNHYSNLRWDTHEANLGDMDRHGTSRKLDTATSLKIRELLAAGTAHRAIAERLGVGRGTVGRIALDQH